MRVPPRTRLCRGATPAASTAVPSLMGDKLIASMKTHILVSYA